MNAPNMRDTERLGELLADEASAALDAVDAPELKGLLDGNPGVRRDALMEAAALAQVAFLRRAQRAGMRPASPGRMPQGLRERLASHGEAAAIRQRAVTSAKRPSLASSRRNSRGTDETPGRATHTPAAAGRRPAGGFLGWALAAVLAVALVVPRTEDPVVAPPADIPSARAGLLGDAPDAITVPWAPPTVAGYEGVTGDVVWSESRQQGYLRLANMPVNDPSRTQYQLWIVAPERDKHPVDGGVFDISSTGEVIIPIQAKLPVRSPSAFAITAEQPGGVVVSAGPLLVVAAT